MKTYIINLAHRTDRRKLFEENNLDKLGEYEFIEGVNGKDIFYKDLVRQGLDTDKNWRDRVENWSRPLLHGDIGCLMSHIKVWERIIDDDEPALILEDDCLLHEHVEVAAQMAEGFDIFYLEFTEMDEQWKHHPDRYITSQIVKPVYPYLLSSYVLTPKAAQILIDGGIKQAMIPDDEYVPRMLHLMNAGGCSQECKIAEQYWREVVGTDIEPKGDDDYFIDFTTHVLTSHDDEDKAYRLRESCIRNGFHVTNVTTGYFDWDTDYPGGGKKLIDLRDYIFDNDLPDHDVILFCDGFDVFVQAELDFIVRRYLSMHKEVIFSAEDRLWPDDELIFPPHYSKYKFLNSGGFIGRVGTLRYMLSDHIEEHHDDQLYFQKTYLQNIWNCGLDYEGYIFQCWDDELEVRNNKVYNPIYNGYPCVIHGNGEYSVKQKWANLYEQVQNAAEFRQYSEAERFEVVADDILLIDFMSPETAREWIEIAELHGGFAPDPHDNVPSHDIHLKSIGLFAETEAFMKDKAARIIDAYWDPQSWQGIRKAFAMKYTAGQQTSLPIHVDHSLITGSVKLNDDYEGATLYWPKQGFDNASVPVGKMILFPGMVTHPHYVDELVSGTKYSATIWGSRYQGDIYDPN